MADMKISQLPPAAVLDGSEMLELVQGGASTRTTAEAIAGLAGAGRHTIWLPATAWQPRVSNGAATGKTETSTNKVVLATLDFDPATIEYAQASVRMPKSWDLGAIKAEVRWMSAGASGSAVWALQALVRNDTQGLDAAFGTAVEVTDAVGAANTERASAETGAITPAGTPAEGSRLVLQLYRNASAGGDTLASDARLLGVTLFYETTDGTRRLMLQVNQLAGFGAGVVEAGGGGPPPSNTLSLAITTNTLNFNVRAAALAAGWDGNTPVAVTLTVQSGARVGSASTANPALRTGAGWPAGSSLVLNNAGTIMGAGGTGGAGGAYGFSTRNGGAGQQGGDAFLNEGLPTSINNTGTIAGGGGGGGGGGAYWNQGGGGGGSHYAGGGGGGGRGDAGGAGGAGGAAGGGADDGGDAGGNGSVSAAGTGGHGAGYSPGPDPGTPGGQGGNGGGLGQAGSAGENGAGNSGGNGGSGGAAGRYAVGDSNNVWTATGTRLGGIAA